MKIIPSSNRGTKQSTLLAVRHGSQVDIYNTSDWSLNASHTGLSCGTAIISPPSGLEIDPTNTWFLTSGDNDYVAAYLISNGNEEFSFNIVKNSTPSISKDGSYVAFGDANDVYIYDTTATPWPQETTFNPVTIGQDMVFAWSHDGSYLAIGDKDGSFVIYETTGWTAYSTTINLIDRIYAINFSPDDTEIAVSLDSGSTTNVLNVMTVQETLVSGNVLENNLSTYDSFDNCFNSDGSTLYAISSYISPGSGYIEGFETSGWTSSISETDLGANPYAIAISADNTLLAVGMNQELQILDATNFTSVSGTPTNANDIYGIAWNKP